MSKEKVLTATKSAGYVALILIAGWILLLALQVMRWSGIIDVNIGGGSNIKAIAWNADSTVLMIQYIELAGYVISSVIMIGMSFLFIRKCLSKLKMGKIFSSRNVGYLWGMTITDLFFELFTTNCNILFGVREIQVNSDIIVSPLFFLVITLLYQLAVYASEENDLTI
ncbi:MAG: hypothetical protein LKF31_11140 [Muribaculaceae bacterium]|jgi:hypothetical protein|nr:hypothetical protein [Muribaculaceae bacterium]